MEDQQHHGEALCFTAGSQGASFSAGVIHAWLVSDRPDPSVVAGISTGAVSAAAMQRAMEERGPLETRTEAKRWDWFGKYLSDITDRPLDVIWKSFPDPVDFSSATMPVRDLSCPPALMRDETRSRHHFWTLTRLGKWLSALPVSIGEAGTLAVLKVRLDECVPIPLIGAAFPALLWRRATYRACLIWIAAKLLTAVALRPVFGRTWNAFLADEDKARQRAGEEKICEQRASAFPYVSPLFGWQIWLTACSLCVAIIAILAGLAILAPLSFAVIVPILIVLLCYPFATPSFDDRLQEIANNKIGHDGRVMASNDTTLRGRITGWASHSCGIRLSLLSEYQLKRRIWNRFSKPGNPMPTVRCSDGPGTNLVIVAAALQTLSDPNKKVAINHQCWAHPGALLVDALAAACAIQPVFPATHLEPGKDSQVRLWVRRKELGNFQDAAGEIVSALDLVDGSVIRKNPLPALFNWLREHEAVHAGLHSESPADSRVHVVYNVPIEPFDAYRDSPDKPDRIDLIEAAQVGILMRARRDTRVEVQQTNFLSMLFNAERSLLKKKGLACAGKIFAVFADELAPERELQFENALSPSRAEGLAAAAEGCRRTLGRLYLVQIRNGSDSSGGMACSDLISQIAPTRARAKFRCGLPEVCAHCSGRIEAYPSPPETPPIVHKDFGAGRDLDLLKELPHLCRPRKPRIAFVASGGVFSGAFHIGLLGALQALDTTPDLVVGASVGTLMAGALAAMRFPKDPRDQLKVLADLTRTFVSVDKNVALTVPLKSAVKQLGLRARTLRLSPRRLSAALRAGTSSDVGYASTGVPPIVIDTLSQLFIIPPAETFKAGSDFLAGRFAKAAAHLISLMRTNTLDSLGIRYAVIGTSLLERVARTLMESPGVDLNQKQPYLDRGIAIFCTTAFVNCRWLMVLGRDALTEGASDFRFLYAALSSSAFPAAFPARQESEVFPGTGLTTNLFSDGGMFDNLPFIPAVEILRDTQTAGYRPETPPKQFLLDRLAAPDLIISGGFTPLPSMERGLAFCTQNEIRARIASLSASVKTNSVISVCNKVTDQLQKIADAAPDNEDEITADLRKVMTGSVVATVVNVVPSTALHVNPAFGMTASLGFDADRVTASIADGCFQTLRGLQSTRDLHTAKSLEALHIAVEKRGPEASVPANHCPYFNVRCAFADAGTPEVYASCAKDPVHKKLSQAGAPPTEPPASSEAC